MSVQGNEACDLNHVVLRECTDSDTQSDTKSRRHPKRVLHFSDGTLEEYSSDDEVDAPKDMRAVSQLDDKSLNWIPWAWNQTLWLSTKMLDGCDYVGECLASFFGITSPKYQFEINEFYRLQALENEMLREQDLEMGGWNDRNRNNLISDSSSTQNRTP